MHRSVNLHCTTLGSPCHILWGARWDPPHSRQAFRGQLSEEPASAMTPRGKRLEAAEEDGWDCLNITEMTDLLYVQPYNGSLGKRFIAGSVFNLEQCGLLSISLRVTAKTDRAPHDLESAPDAFSLPTPLLRTQLPAVPASLWFSRSPMQVARLCHLFLITLRRMNKLTAACHLWGIHFKAPNRCLKPHSVLNSIYILCTHHKAQFINQDQGLPVVPKNKTGQP